MMRTILHDLSKSTLTLTTTAHPTPNFSKNEHLVKVLAVAPCAGELSWPGPAGVTATVPGVDAVGTIVSSPPSSPFQPGSRCYWRTTYPSQGSLREYSLALTSELALAPKSLSAVDAASIPVSALTAWQVLFEQFKLPRPSTVSISNGATAKPHPRPRIFINGATGSVGLWVLQLSRLANLTTIATSSPKNTDLIKSLGADEIIDYTRTSPASYVSQNDQYRKFDYVFDAVGPASLPALWPTLNKSGRLITIVPTADMDFAGYRPAPSTEQIANKEVEEEVSGEFFIMHPDGTALGEISTLVELGKCRGVVDSVFEFDEESVKKAFEKVDSGRARGKVVIKVADEE